MYEKKVCVKDSKLDIELWLTPSTSTRCEMLVKWVKLCVLHLMHLVLGVILHVRTKYSCKKSICQNFIHTQIRRKVAY